MDRGQPRGPCRYISTRKSTAKLASPWNSEAHSDAAMVGTRKILSGSIGAATRASIATNTPMSTTPPTRNPTVEASSGAFASLVIAQSTPNRPSPSVTMPSGSRRWRVRSPLSRSTRSAPTMASTPVGTLIQKIHRHDT